MSRKTIWFVLAGLVAALLLAGVVSNFASTSPDGLNAATREGCTFDAEGNITGGSCIAQRERENQTKDSPFAGYGIRGLENGFASKGLAGVAGVLVTFALGGGLFWLARRGSRGPAAADGATAADGAGGAGGADGETATGGTRVSGG